MRLLHTFAGNFPLWRPAGDHPGLFQISSEKAFHMGWKTRLFQETALDCLISLCSRGEYLDWTDALFLPTRSNRSSMHGGIGSSSSHKPTRIITHPLGCCRHSRD